MKRVLVVAIVLAAVLAIVASQTSQIVWGKAHVPAHKVQVCHKGKAINVGAAALGGHQRHGDAQLPACDFNNVFQKGDDCSSLVDSDENGRIDGDELPNPRDDAGGVTPACPPGTF